MPSDEVTVVQLCGKCGSQVGSFTIKKDNLMLTSKERIWCPECKEETPEVRDIEGRLEYIDREVASYPKPAPAEDRPRDK